MSQNQNETVMEQEDTQHGRFLMFALDAEDYGIEIRFVTEIVGMQPISVLPEVPEYIKGIINLRGKIIPVIDMRLKFKKDAIEYNDRTCIIVIDTGEISAGLIVDNVADVTSIEDNDIVPPPDTRSGIKNTYIQGIGKAGDEVKLLVNCEKLFAEDEIIKINDTVKE